MTLRGDHTVADPAVIEFEGELDVADDRLSRALDDVLARGARHVVVDLLNVTFIDSSVVRALVLAHRQLDGRGGWIRVVYIHHLIRRVIDICGLAETLPQYSTVDAAVRGVAATSHHEMGVTGERSE